MSLVTSQLDPDRLRRDYAQVREALLAERTIAGHWEGELSTSPLSTATAVMALLQVDRARRSRSQAGEVDGRDLRPLILGGARWLVAHQNPDGGWGDTVKSLSNISTTMLGHAVLHAVANSWHDGAAEHRMTSVDRVMQAAGDYISRAGGIPALIARYGQDKTFSVPILTHCALAGLVDWRSIPPLPFELACLPARFYKTVRLPVVSYALPALIAIGQVRQHFAPTSNPFTGALRRVARRPSLRVLERIQPPNGGFLEATPLTSFVTMSLAAMGLVDHPVVRGGVEFLVNSVRPDGSWPIDTNLATWVTTLSVNALGDDLPAESRPEILNWLLAQQYQAVHPYTNADPGGWAWTDLPGGVPDADDTPGAILALLRLVPRCEADPGFTSELRNPYGSFDMALARAMHWLHSLQNRDGGWPTFCRGWGTLPFDRSSCDLTAHAIRASIAWQTWSQARTGAPRSHEMFRLYRRSPRARQQGFRFLERSQRPDGSWLPLWFGNQFAPEDINPTYGTAKVLAAYRDGGRLDTDAARRGLAWLRQNQNSDGGWGAGPGTPSSVEETALAVEALLDDAAGVTPTAGGINWLLDRIEAGTISEPTPIGFYFAKLWYFERLYPLIFTVSCLRQALHKLVAAADEAK